MSQKPINGHAEMLIRRPPEDVFDAFVDPQRTSQFWFTRGSGRLEPGKQVRWTWDMYDVSVDVDVKAIEHARRIAIEWSGYGSATQVEWSFTPQPDNTTFVSVIESGFSGDDHEVATKAIDSTGGFSLVLAGLKAYLEHNLRLNLVADHHPASVKT